MDADRTVQIRTLNDTLRRTFSSAHGRVVVTAGIDALPAASKSKIIERVQVFDAFTPDNDPQQEHDFGDFEIEGRKVFWKIDYYTPYLRGSSEDPADPALTTRVLTIMLAEEY